MTSEAAYRGFLDALRATPRRWVVTNGQLRMHVDGGPTCCPISAVFGGSKVAALRTAIERGGFPYELAISIIQAADYPHLHGIRRDLLRACGVPERLELS